MKQNRLRQNGFVREVQSTRESGSGPGSKPPAPLTLALFVVQQEQNTRATIEVRTNFFRRLLNMGA